KRVDGDGYGGNDYVHRFVDVFDIDTVSGSEISFAVVGLAAAVGIDVGLDIVVGVFFGLLVRADVVAVVVVLLMICVVVHVLG
ncbi:hypothetical protein AAHH78_36985, partial [Burkholderia pseudomallei]